MYSHPLCKEVRQEILCLNKNHGNFLGSKLALPILNPEKIDAHLKEHPTEKDKRDFLEVLIIAELDMLKKMKNVDVGKIDFFIDEIYSNNKENSLLTPFDREHRNSIIGRCRWYFLNFFPRVRSL